MSGKAAPNPLWARALELPWAIVGLVCMFCTQSCKARPDTWNHGSLPSAKVAKSCKDAQFWSISLRKRVTVDGSATCCYSWETELVGRAKKGVMPTAPSVPRRSPGGAPVKRLQLLGQMLPHLSTKVSIWWIPLLLIFCYFPGFVLSWKPAQKSRIWADSCPIAFQWPWHFQGRLGILPWPVVCIASRPFG